MTLVRGVVLALQPDPVQRCGIRLLQSSSHWPLVVCENMIILLCVQVPHDGCKTLYMR